MKRLLFSVGICFTMILLITFGLTCAGVIDLRIVSEIEFAPWTEYLGSSAMLMLNMFFVLSISLRLFDKRIIPVLCGIMPVILVINLSPIAGTLWSSAVVPFVYIIVLSFVKFRSEIPKILIMHGALFIVTAFYQQCSGCIKLYGFGLHFYNCNIGTAFIYSIDLYLFYILLYCVVKRYDLEMVVWRPGFLKGHRKEVLAEIEESREDVSDLNARQQRVFTVLTILYFIAQSIFILGVNALINKVFHFLGGFYVGAIELVIAWISLEIFRLSLGKTFHSRKPIVCNAVSLIVFFVISRFALPLHISLFFNVCVAALLALLIHKYVIGHEEYTALLEAHKAATERKPFKVVGASEEDLIAQCRAKRIRQENQQFIIDYFVKGISAGDMVIADKSGTRTEAYFRSKAYKLKKRLES